MPSVLSPQSIPQSSSLHSLQSTVYSLQSSVFNLQSSVCVRLPLCVVNFCLFRCARFQKLSNYFFFQKKKQSYKIYTHTHTHTDKMKYFNMWVRYLNIYFLFFAFSYFISFFFLIFFGFFLPNFLCRVANAFYFLLTCFEYLSVFFYIIGLCITNLRSMYADIRVEFPMPQINKNSSGNFIHFFGCSNFERKEYSRVEVRKVMHMIDINSKT